MNLGFNKIRLISGILMVLVLAACTSSSSPARQPSTDQFISPSETDKSSKSYDSVEGTETTPKGTGSCPVDTRGVVGPSRLSQVRSKIRRRAWHRERSLSLGAHFRSILPDILTPKHSKLVSFEVYRHARSGRFLKNYQCVRWRILSDLSMKGVLAELNASHVLTTVKPNLIKATLPQGVLMLNVGVNEQAVTQVDFSLVPHQVLPAELLYAEDVPLVQWLKSFSVVGFEYGLYISGRKGLRFPGLKRTVMVVDVDLKTVESQLQVLGFTRNEADRRAFVHGSQAVTTRSYSGQGLSVSWQYRLPMEAMATVPAE